MDLFRKILVPLELAELDERIMHFVAGLGRYGIGEALLANVKREIGLEAPVAKRREQDRGKLIASLASILTDAGVNVTAVPLAGVPTEEILHAAHEEHVSLLVTATHGKSVLNEFVVGSVSETVGRRSKVPVLMIPYRMLLALDTDEAAFSAGAHVFDRLVYPTDFSDVSERMLDLVKSLDGDKVGEVVVTHIVDPKELRNDHQREATLRSDNRILASISGELDERGIRSSRVLESGPVIAELLDLAENRGATSFIMGSHGRGLSEEIFVGSVSQNVIRMAGLPVFVTH
ncbi:MAG TPA: universal stress protein [Coriobacteriia bacterium]|jgi:nucleotide-binding universal stress UspA family protein